MQVTDARGGGKPRTAQGEDSSLCRSTEKALLLLPSEALWRTAHPALRTSVAQG